MSRISRGAATAGPWSGTCAAGREPAAPAAPVGGSSSSGIDPAWLAGWLLGWTWPIATAAPLNRARPTSQAITGLDILVRRSFVIVLLVSGLCAGAPLRDEPAAGRFIDGLLGLPIEFPLRTQGFATTQDLQFLFFPRGLQHLSHLPVPPHAGLLHHVVGSPDRARQGVQFRVAFDDLIGRQARVRVRQIPLRIPVGFDLQPPETLLGRLQLTLQISQLQAEDVFDLLAVVAQRLQFHFSASA